MVRVGAAGEEQHGHAGVEGAAALGVGGELAVDGVPEQSESVLGLVFCVVPGVQEFPELEQVVLFDCLVSLSAGLTDVTGPASVGETEVRVPRTGACECPRREEDFALNRPRRGLLGSTRLRRRPGRSPMVAAEGPLSQRLGKVAVSTRVVATPPAVPSTRYWEIVIPDARAVTSV